MKLIAALAIAGSLAGCAFTPQTATIAPKLEVQQENVGNGTTVAFRTTDERASKSLGNRGAAFGKGAEIKSAEDVAAVIHGKVVEGLQKKGFTVSDYNDSAPVRLSLELRSLDYSTSTGFWTGGVKVVAAIKAIGLRDGKSYEKMYRSDSEKRVVIVPGAGANEAQLNAAAQDILEQLFADIGLMRHLAGG
jgi:uncharacterized lipoprotein YajG